MALQFNWDIGGILPAPSQPELKNIVEAQIR